MLIEIEAEYICTFENFQSWVNHAQTRLSGWTNRDKIVCVDMQLKVCNIGADFRHSDNINMFPVMAFRLVPSNENYPLPKAAAAGKEEQP